jgi:hypothetical protein
VWADRLQCLACKHAFPHSLWPWNGGSNCFGLTCIGGLTI